MENNIENKPDLINRIQKVLLERKKLFISILVIFVIFSVGLVLLDYKSMKDNKDLSDKYIKAGIFLANNNKEKSKKIYKDIILSKNKFYSVVALNNILDNEMIDNENEMLELFKIIDEIGISKEERELVKLKKALYLIKRSKKQEGKKLLDEIISGNSKWKNIALEIVEKELKSN